jgi:RHS repeat-associated protein
MSLATYDVANELMNWNGTTITPDANGNVLNDGLAAYTWNARNQLVSRGSTSCQYDPFGRRTLNAEANNLLYEGLDVEQELSGSSPVANRIIGDLDEFFSRTDSTGTYSPITDALGSVLALTNSTGNIAVQYGYDPFGNTTSNGGASTNVFQYTGRENDGNGLYFNRARYYDSQFGRFISEDPLGFVGGQANLYSYVNDSPTNMIDPLGLVSMAGTGCKKCYSGNSFADRGVRFFSLTRLPETWQEWAIGGGAKYAIFSSAKAGATSAGGAESMGAAAIGTAGEALAIAGSVAMVGATLADIDCQIGPVEPYTEK